MKKVFYRICLKMLLKIYDFVYQKAGAFAIRYYGMHPKHMFEDFHGFFIENIPEGASILDVGCSRGELTVDISKKASRIVAYDVSAESIATAKEKNSGENIHYFVGEAAQDMPPDQFDLAICSNILEHLPDARQFLEKLHTITGTILIRVPNANNNWIMGVKKDLGENYFLDPEHHREYTPALLKKDLEISGWRIRDIHISHELRVVAKRRNRI